MRTSFFLVLLFLCVCSSALAADVSRGINVYLDVIHGKKFYEKLSAVEREDLSAVAALVDAGKIIVPSASFKPTQQQLAEGRRAAITYTNATATAGGVADPCLLANLMAGDNMRGDGAAAAGYQLCVVGGGAVVGAKYNVLAVSQNHDTFAIAGTVYRALVPCPWVSEGAEVIFVHDSKNHCVGRTFASVLTGAACRLTCN